MSISSSERSPSAGADSLSERVARQMKLQSDIEATLDLADACERRGEFGRAVECLDRARALSGGLSFAGLAQRARCVRELEGRNR
jgi:Tetratricopeptide repeat